MRAGATALPISRAGTYTLKVSQQGFKTFEQTDITVSANNVNRVDVVLQVGGVNETVTVTGEGAVLQTDTSEVHADLVANELENLPVPLGRNYQQIYRTLPGFSPPSQFTLDPQQPVESAGVPRQRHQRRSEQHAR